MSRLKKWTNPFVNPLLTPDEKGHKTPKKYKRETQGCHFVWQCCVRLPWWAGITYLNLFAGRLSKTTGSPPFPRMGGFTQWDRETLIRLELLWSTAACPSLSLFRPLHPTLSFENRREVREDRKSPTFFFSLPHSDSTFTFDYYFY